MLMVYTQRVYLRLYLGNDEMTPPFAFQGADLGNTPLPMDLNSAAIAGTSLPSRDRDIPTCPTW